MTNPIDAQMRRSEFPFTAEWAYLNTASYGPFPQRTVRAMQAWVAGIGDAPNYFETARPDTTADATRMMAALTGSASDAIAWVPSLADGPSQMSPWLGACTSRWAGTPTSGTS